MKKEIIGIIICVLLFSVAISAIGTNVNIKNSSNATLISNNINNYESQLPLPGQYGVDQEQTSDCGNGVEIRPPFCLAQSFVPSKDKLVSIRLYIHKKGNANGYINITCNVSIDVSESNLTGASISAWDIQQQGTWVMFDFPDIDVTPGVPLYIIIKSDGGTNTDCFCWFYDIKDPYDKGEAWISPDNGKNWITLWEYWQYNPQTPEPDFCFITYFKKSRNRAIYNSCFLRFIDMFPILQRMLEMIK